MTAGVAGSGPADGPTAGLRPTDAQGVLRQFEKVTLVGAGTVGISWAALFLGHGLQVRINDPDPDIEDRVRAELRQYAPTLDLLGLDTQGIAERVQFEAAVERAVEDADVIQESGPEDLALKRELFARIGRAMRPTALVLSSTSSLRATDLSQDMVDPSRLLVGHPFNPPHLIPLVEVVPGARTDPAATRAAVTFYRAVGKTPLVLHKEIPGFVANRLQAALFKECVHLVLEGVATPEEIDTVVTASLGLRWAVAGPFLTFHLGGGPAGLRHMLEHLGPAMNTAWRQLGEPSLEPATVRLLVQQAEDAFRSTPYEDLVRRRDRQQLAVIAALATDAPPT